MQMKSFRNFERTSTSKGETCAAGFGGPPKKTPTEKWWEQGHTVGGINAAGDDSPKRHTGQKF